MSTIQTLNATASALPPYGFYIGHLTAIEDMGKVTGQYGEQHQVRLVIRTTAIHTLDDPDDEEMAEEYIDQDVYAYANLTFTPKAKLRRWCSQIAGREIEDNEEFDVDEILAQDVRYQIGPNTVGNPTVKDVWKHKKAAKKRGTRKRVQPAPEPEPDDEFEGELVDDEDLDESEDF